MACEHKRIMSRNCELYCLDCGAKLDAPPEKKPEPKRKTKKGAKANEPDAV